ncbi:hypothetical protein V3C99_018772 [Haemonchus contortus]|uniref:Secreted RxLR effector peptide protein n=1 Tax=Haemonchus contortus TaxID=6289 RepID=A0A7I4Z0G9_HAECO
MVNILTVTSVSLLLLQTNSFLATDGGKEVMDSVYDETLHFEDEPSYNLTSEQIKNYYEKDSIERWNKTRDLAAMVLPYRKSKAQGGSSYRTDTNVKKRSRLAMNVLGVSPKWRSSGDSGIELPSKDVPPVRAMTADPEITLFMNHTPILDTKNTKPHRIDFLYTNTNQSGDKKIQDTSGNSKTGSSYKGVWVDKDTAVQRKKLKITPATRSFRDDIRELKYEVRLMKTIVEKLVRASHILTRKSGSVIHKNQKGSRSLKLMASRLAARQMIDGHTTDSQMKKSLNHT